MPLSFRTGILLSFFSNSKMINHFLQVGVWFNPYRGCTQPKCTVNITNVSYASDKMSADFSLKMHQKRLAAGLRPDLLGELTALP